MAIACSLSQAQVPLTLKEEYRPAKSPSESKPAHDHSAARILSQAGRIDPAETGCGSAVRVISDKSRNFA